MIGSWGKAIEVPGLAALNTGKDASVTAISCPSAGNCTAGGMYSDRHGDLDQGFVVDERNGRWDKAIEVPGLGALNTGKDAEVNAVSCSAGLDVSDNTFALSCAPGGPCAAGGLYVDASGDGQAFVTQPLR